MNRLEIYTTASFALANYKGETEMYIREKMGDREDEIDEDNLRQAYEDTVEAMDELEDMLSEDDEEDLLTQHAKALLKMWQDNYEA